MPSFGLLLSENPDLTREEALAAIYKSADKINPFWARYDRKTGFSKRYGFGKINAYKALKYITR